MAKLFAFGCLIAALFGLGTLTRASFNLSPVCLINWQCPACSCSNVSDAAYTYYPRCLHCGERYGVSDWTLTADAGESL
ncbi:hypothetical protein [Stratiformator vulcanicus]|uniref:Uncharacterized protein n=1 Tax=Stratiformator vulcanicus TaxID=2527980 RepID=A0A517QX47_9PLAN|nr:hypothetical protein [Stratiformator vulcanicus]QDT36148.1 hypothetical protein Pan189_05030 [Stratiformator vulcanicus]